jgi:hypothetical protein
MGKVDTFIDKFFLKHGETRYDPVKAHEYYMKTRELKGRRSSSQLKGAVKKEGWAYTKKQVEEERKSTLENAGSTNKEAVAQLREKATARREEIRGKLEQAMLRLTTDSKTAREGISADVKSKIDALPKMPEGLTKQQKSEFAAKRREEIAKIRGEASQKREDVSVYVDKAREGERDFADVDREQVASELKDSLDKAKAAYESAKENIKAKYEAELDKEFESVRAL